MVGYPNTPRGEGCRPLSGQNLMHRTVRKHGRTGSCNCAYYRRGPNAHAEQAPQRRGDIHNWELRVRHWCTLWHQRLTLLLDAVARRKDPGVGLGAPRCTLRCRLPPTRSRGRVSRRCSCLGHRAAYDENSNSIAEVPGGCRGRAPPMATKLPQFPAHH